MDKSFKHTAQRVLLEGFVHNFYNLKKEYKDLSILFDEIDQYINKEEVDEETLETIAHNSQEFASTMRRISEDIKGISYMLEDMKMDFEDDFNLNIIDDE